MRQPLAARVGIRRPGPVDEYQFQEGDPASVRRHRRAWKRLKACDADDCLEAFYDQSRNRSGRWCDMAVCGNRTKVRAYRSKRSR